MPDRRRHRGAHPADAKLFGAEAVGRLRSAVADYSLLLTKGYAGKSSLKLVGDRFSLTQRQRVGVMRASCSDEQLVFRRRRCVGIERLRGAVLAIDGYNVLITVEAAISGGVVFKSRDGTFKDLASIHGTYRKVAETVPAVELIGRFLEQVEVGEVLWVLDKPVSNSGRLKKLIEKVAAEHSWAWRVELSIGPDARLIASERVVASSDSVVLDGCNRWVNLAAEIIYRQLSSVWLVDLSDEGR